MTFKFNIKYLSLYCLILFLVCARSEIPTFHSKSSNIISDDIQSWTHEVSIENGVEIYWNANNAEWLTMEISAPTQGYVGVGFSPKGGMAGSDFIIGWVDDSSGSPYLQDYFAVTNGPPTLDPSQDYQLIVAIQTNNYTTVRFRRRWNTCDKEHDMELLGDDTIRLIWSWSEYDPKTNLHWHGPIHRGTRSVFLKTVRVSKQFPDDEPVPGVQEWFPKVDNFHVPVQQTIYHCRIYKFPNYDKKQHIIGYRPVIEKKNRPYVHHITIYKCAVPPSVGDTKTMFEKYLDHKGGDCLTGEVPIEWIQYCYEFMIAVGIGDEGEMFPENVGLPFVSNENGEPNFIRFEIHYDNPGLHKIVDSSGLKLFHTENLREMEMGMLFIGNKVTPFQVIPQNVKRFTTYSFCSGSCTNTALPESGVKINGLLLHAHMAATAIRLRHVRNGKELAPIAIDSQYDFNYQQYRVLLKEVRILPGDDLIVECDYNSLNHDDLIIGGYPSRREMCQVMLWIHPSVDMLKDCRSQVEFHSFFKALDIESVEHPLLTEMKLPYIPENFTPANWSECPGDDSISMIRHFPQYQKVESNPWKDITGTPYQNNKDDKKHQHESSSNKVSIYNAILKKSSNEEDAELLQNQWRNGSYYIYCAGSGGQRIPNKEIIRSFPTFEPHVSQEKSRNICKLSGVNGGSSTYIYTTTPLNMVIVVILSKIFL